MIRTAAAATVVAVLALLVPSASAAPSNVSNINVARPPACTHPAAVRDGLIEVRCFPVIPAKQFPAAPAKCSHIDAWTTGHSIQIVNGQRYRITQKVRDDVWVCKS